MANTIQLRRSAVASAVPTTAQLALGELAVNTYDGKLFIKKNNGTESIVEIGAGGGGSASITVSTTAPVSPTNGAMWWDSTYGKLKIYYNDGSTSQWVDAASGNVSRETVRVQSLTSTASIAPDVDNYDFISIAAQAAALTVNAATGTIVDGTRLTVRLKDNGTSRAITWNVVYVNGGAALPTVTTAGKWHHIGFIYNSNISAWMCVAAGVQA